MLRRVTYVIISFLISLSSYAVCYSYTLKPDSVNDGPYIFNSKNSITVKWIENNRAQRDNIDQENYPGIKRKFNLLNEYNDLTDAQFLKPDHLQSYTGIDSISILSDIHGQYDFYIGLLKSTGIIDNNLNWKYGKGHLVVLGDVFDRGDRVTEVLWHLFGLEKQAEKAGGMVHMVLGNHEIMVLSKDLKYTNDKYLKYEKLFNVEYFDLYSESSVLGKWLRVKPVIISINDVMFVHGGISIDIVHKNMKIEQINRIFSEKIVGEEMKKINEDEDLKFLDNSNGPVWYRGYFNDSKFCESKVDSILNFYSMKHIVVGHTECETINSLFGNKILGIDTGGIMDDHPGEILIYNKGSFYRGFITGKRIKL